MSNLIQELQNGLKINNKLYEEIKNEEILSLIKNYKENSYKYSTYELYFNNKCISDYKLFLVSNLNNEIEKILSKKFLNVILEMKIKLLFKKYKNNLDNLLKQFNINNDDLLKKIKETDKLMKQIDLKKELKKPYEIEQNKFNNIKNNLNDIIKEQILIYIDTNEKSNLLEDYINYLIRINKRLINMKINTDEYNNFLMNIFSEGDYDNIEDMINDNVTKDYVNQDNLSFMIIKYNNIKDITLEELINNIPDNINTTDVNDLKDITFSELKNKSDINIAVKNHLLIDIIETCKQPLNEDYLDYLKKIYFMNNMKEQYQKILKKNKEISNLLIEYEDDELVFAKNIINKIKNKKDFKLDIINKSLTDFMTEQEYNNLLNEYIMINDIVNNDESYEILDYYITTNLSKLLQKLRDFNLTTDIKDLKKNLKINDYGESYLNEQFDMYIDKKTSDKKNIYISLNSLFKNNNIIDYFKFFQKLEKKLNLLNDNKIIKNLNDILQNTLSQILEHYIKSIDNFKLLDDDNNDKLLKRLYYNLNDDVNTRVYVNDQIEKILNYILKNNNDDDIHEYIYSKILDHLFNYKYYNIQLDYNESIIMKLRDTSLLINYYNIIKTLNIIYNNKYLSNDIKELENSINKYKNTKFNLLFDVTKKFIKLDEFNNDLKIFTRKEIDYMKYRWNDFKNLFTFTNKKNQDDDDIISQMKLVKMILNDIFIKIKEYNINLYNVNKNKEEKKIENNIINDVKRLMNDEIKFNTYKIEKPNKVFIYNNINIDTKIEDYGLTYLTISSFQKIYNKNTNLSKREQLIIDSIKDTIKILEIFYDIKYNNIEKLTNDILSEKERIIIISKQNSKNIDYKNIKQRLLIENKNISNMTKYLTILYFIDFMIHTDLDVYNLKQKQENVKEKLLNKKIYIISDSKMKYNKDNIDTIIKKDNNKFYTKNKNILSRENFILLDSLKDKVVKITKGIYKGNYGRIINFKEKRNLTKELSKYISLEKKYYENLILKINEKILQINNNTSDNIVDDIELTQLEKYRKKIKINISNTDDDLEDELNNFEQQQYIYNIKLNPRINKVLTYDEESFLIKYREERIQELKYQKNIYFNILNNNQNNDSKVVVKINEGEKIHKNIYLDLDDIKFNTDIILNKEIIDLIKTNNDNKPLLFNNLYDLTKFLFNYNNIMFSDNDNEIFVNIYKKSLEIYNYTKINNMNKYKIVEKLKESIRKIKKNIKILQNKKNKEDNTKYLTKIKKLLKVKETQLKKIINDIDNDNLDLFYNKEIKNFNNDLKKENNIYYFKENTSSLNKDINNINKLKIQKQTEDIKIKDEMNQRINNIILELKNNINIILDKDITDKNKLIKYLRDNIFEDEEDEDDEMDIDDIIKELENFDNKKLSWVEIDEMPSEDFSDFESDSDF